MEYVSGERLKDVIDRNPNGMPLDEVAALVRGICAGVAYLHDHGIVHRDLKPGNIFLDDGIVKIGDYGLSKFISCSRRSGQTESVGTVPLHGPGDRHGRSTAKRSTSTPWASSCTRCSPAACRSTARAVSEIIMKHLTAAPDVSPLPEKLRPIVQRAFVQGSGKAISQRGRNGKRRRSGIRCHGGRQTFVAAHAAASANAGHNGRSKGHVYRRQRRKRTVCISGRYNKLERRKQFLFRRSRRPPVVSRLRKPSAEDGNNSRSWWHGPQLNRTAKILLAAFLITVAIVNVGWILPAAAILGSIYLVYFGIRMIVLAQDQRPLAARPATHAFPPARPAPMPPGDICRRYGTRRHGAAGAGQSQTIAKRRRRWHEVASEQLRRKTPGERLMELTGSMLMSSVVVGVVSFLVLLVSGHPVNSSVSTWSNFAWLGLTSLIGTWTVLVPAKMWEGVDGDIVRRRFLQVILGLAVGAAAFGLDQYLIAELNTLASDRHAYGLASSADDFPERSNSAFARVPCLFRRIICRSSLVAASQPHANVAI